MLPLAHAPMLPLSPPCYPCPALRHTHLPTPSFSSLPLTCSARSRAHTSALVGAAATSSLPHASSCCQFQHAHAAGQEGGCPSQPPPVNPSFMLRDCLRTPTAPHLQGQNSIQPQQQVPGLACGGVEHLQSHHEV